MNSWTAVTFEEVFLLLGRRDQYWYSITDCTKTEGQGQRRGTGFLWIRQAVILLREKTLKSAIKCSKKHGILYI